MNESEKDLESIYQKVVETYKIEGGDEVWKIFVTEFKGVPDCARRLDQLSEVLNGCEMTYEERDGFFTVNFEGSCDFGGCQDLDCILCDDLTEEELKVFFSLLPKKDDFWGWYYKCGYIDIEDYIVDLSLSCIIAALIDPDYKETVNIIYNGEEICEVKR